MSENETMELLNTTTVENLRLSLMVNKLLTEKLPAVKVEGSEQELHSLRAEVKHLTETNIALIKTTNSSQQDYEVLE